MSQSYVNKYTKSIAQWANKNIKEIQLQQSYKQFLFHIQVQFNFPVTFDSNIVHVLQNFLNKIQFQAFDLKKYTNKNRQKIFAIADCLFANKFIGKKQYQTIQTYRSFCLKDNIKHYLQIINESPMNQKERMQLWPLVIPVSNISFWNLVDSQQIEDSLITELYNKQVFEINNKVPEAVINRKRLIQNPNIIEQIRYQIPRRGNRILAPANRVQNHLNSAQDSQHKSQNFKTNYQGLQQIVRTDFFRWMNEQKYEKMHAYIKYARSVSNEVVGLLTQTAFESSLFYNRDNKYILQNLKRFVVYVQGMLRQFSQEVDYVDLFGSLRSSIALVNQYDLDVTVVPIMFKRRQEQTNLLFKFNSKIQESKLPWVKSSFVNYRHKIPVPFLKIELESFSIKRQFQLNRIAKIDVTVGNKTAIVNSQILSCFAQKQEILLFCLLVKLWAKTNNIINALTPMEGLSSYGVVLMCMFYLMKTQQLDFLQPQVYVNAKELLLPKNFRCQMLSIQTNFVQFLKFYGQKGVFHKQRMVACLLENPPLDKYDEEVIINMYDFIDDRNPGRLSISKGQFFYQQFRKAQAVMKTKDPVLISSLFDVK